MNAGKSQHPPFTIFSHTHIYIYRINLQAKFFSYEAHQRMSVRRDASLTFQLQYLIAWAFNFHSFGHFQTTSPCTSDDGCPTTGIWVREKLFDFDLDKIGFVASVSRKCNMLRSSQKVGIWHQRWHEPLGPWPSVFPKGVCCSSEP